MARMTDLGGLGGGERMADEAGADKSRGEKAEAGLYRVTRIATSDFPPEHRFEAWRDTAYSVVDLETPGAGDPEISGLKRSVRGALGVFATHEGSAHRTVLTAAASRTGATNAIVISVMTQGHVGLDSPCGTQLTTLPGRLVAYDAARPMRYHWSRGKEIYLLLPRTSALAALGGDLPGLVLPLDTNPLGALVREQMVSLDRHAEHLDPKELALALDALHAMVGLLLQRVGRELRGDGEADPGAVFLAARRYIQANYMIIGLTPETIARALGASRATLYRAFRQNDTTVMDTLREVRLAMARKAIETGVGRSISAVAYQCGFADASSFGKLFRSRFGVSPRAWREQFD